MKRVLTEPLNIIATGENYSVKGLLLPDGKVVIKKGSMISPFTRKLVYAKIENLRHKILTTKVDKSFCLIEDVTFDNHSNAATVVVGSMQTGYSVFKTLDDIPLEEYMEVDYNVQPIKRVLFCNIAYMKYYDNRFLDIPENGGAYVSQHNDAFEKYNFQECSDGYYRGFVETKHHKGYEQGNLTNTFNQIHIERIDPEYKNKDVIDNVLVVFCAKPNGGKTIIVGWYKNAKVYRYRPTYEERIYNLEAKISDCTLLNVVDREYPIPRANGENFGFGQSNVLFTDVDKAKDLVSKVLDYINGNGYESIIENEIVEEQQEFIENGTGKKVYINTYERNPKARKECIKIHGTKCKICGFDAKEIYGEEYEGKIHIHHIVPIHQVNKEYKINPETDLIPVCPNCHMILHTKVKGVDPTVSELQEKFKG